MPATHQRARSLPAATSPSPCFGFGLAPPRIPSEAHEAIAPQLLTQARARDSEIATGGRLVPPVSGERAQERAPFDLREGRWSVPVLGHDRIRAVEHEVIGTDDGAFGFDAGAAQDVSQLTHIAWPRVLLEPRERRWAQELTAAPGPF